MAPHPSLTLPSYTNSDGRCPGLLPPGQMKAGTYKLSFDTEGYWKKRGQESFYPYVEVRARDGGCESPGPAMGRLARPSCFSQGGGRRRSPALSSQKKGVWGLYHNLCVPALPLGEAVGAGLRVTQALWTEVCT